MQFLVRAIRFFLVLTNSHECQWCNFQAYVLDDIFIAGNLHQPIYEDIDILIAAQVFSAPASKKRV